MPKIERGNVPKVTLKNIEEPPPKFLIPTGNPLLNLACSGNQIDAGYGAGKMTNLIGDSSSGKTVLALTMMAEVAINPKFDDYELIFDDVESALEINIAKMFGKKLKMRMKIVRSNTIEDFYGEIVTRNDAGKPFIYILDSFDALTSREEIKRSKQYSKNKDKDEDDDKQKGSYKTEKPKMASEMLRVCTNGLYEAGSFLLIISQTRDNIGYGAMFNPRTRSGGKALKFYATHEIWLAGGASHKQAGLSIGTDCMVKITKNKLTGKRREVYFPIYDDYGVDTIESCINFFIDRKVWTKAPKTGIIKSNWAEEMSMKHLIRHIENNMLQKELYQMVGSLWLKVEEKAQLDRKPRFE